MPTRSGNGRRVWLTGGSVLGLVLGLALGVWAHAVNEPATLALVNGLESVGSVWGNALRMCVVPLIVAQLVASLVSLGGTGRLGRIGGMTLAVFVLMLALGAVATTLATPLVLARMTFANDALAALQGIAPATPKPVATPTGFGGWLLGLIPPNVFRAAAQDDLLGVMLFVVAFALAVARMTPERRQPVEELARTIGDAMLTLVGWIMLAMPIAVFVLAMGMGSRAGLGAAQIVVAFVVLTCVTLFAFTLLFYPIGAIAGRISIGRFAAAILPSQFVAVSTRSSIASLPAMIESAQTRLRLHPEISSLVLPLAVATFKVNRTISAPLQFLFLAHVYAIDLSFGQIATFTAASFILSFSTIGIPSGGGAMRGMPLYLAAGIPVEGYLITEAVDAIPDIFKTLTNVTGNLTAAMIVERLSFRSEPRISAIAEPAIDGVAAGV